MRYLIVGFLSFAVVGFAFVGSQPHFVLGQDKADTPKVEPPKEPEPKEPKAKKGAPKTEPKSEAVEEKFDQKKADIETLKSANLPIDGKAMLEFFQKHTVSDDNKARLASLITQLGDDDFDKRENASEEIEKFGVSAIGLLRQAERTGNPEVLRRCSLALKNIEKVPTRTLASAAARLLSDLKPDGMTETLLNYLPLAEDDTVADDVRGALAAVAVKDGKADPILKQALTAKEVIKRSAAAEAFARSTDKAMRDEMRQFMTKESDAEIKLRIAVGLVTVAKEKEVVAEMIKLMTQVPIESGWRAEEILIRLAAEKGPTVSLGGDQASRDKTRDEWLKWWETNQKDIDLAKLDELERTLGYTLIVEMDIRGVGGRVKEITPDGKARWEITSVQFPTDAVVMPGNRVIVAEQNTNRVSERDTTNGKEIWGETVNQPVGLQKLSNGNLVVISRNQVVEWDRSRKAVSTITRQQYDIVAGAKLRNGNFAVYTQQGQIITFDKTGKQLDTFAAGRANYNSTMQVLPNGKLVVTQFRGVAEVDLAAKKADVILNYNYPTSAFKLPNGNVIVSNQNNYQVVEMEPKTNKTVWEHKPENNNNNFYRAWRAKRR